MPDQKPGIFKKGDPRINRKGRPPVGLSFADYVRARVGTGGEKLVDAWCAVALGSLPRLDESVSSNVLRLQTLKQLMGQADMTNRLTASRLLAERGFGQPKQDVDHRVTGDLNFTAIYNRLSSSTSVSA